MASFRRARDWFNIFSDRLAGVFEGIDVEATLLPAVDAIVVTVAIMILIGCD